MSVNRMVASTCAFVCALTGFFALGVGNAEAGSAVASRTAKIQKQMQQLERLEHKYEGTIRFWYNPERRWTLYLNQMDKPCWKVKLYGPGKLCTIARGSVRVTRQKLRFIRSRIDHLMELILPIGNESHWRCIHSHEGAWTANTGNGYYGGLQMDMDFQRTYGPEFLRKYGTADKWPPRIQMHVAERARKSGRGYHPWPNTARFCGLI